MNKFIDKLERRCMLEDGYDDNCDQKINKYGSYYVCILGGNGERYCPNCTVGLILASIEAGEKFTFEDKWGEGFDVICRSERTGSKPCSKCKKPEYAADLEGRPLCKGHYKEYELEMRSSEEGTR